MNRLLSAILAVAVLAPLLPAQVDAIETWCVDDPLVSVDGRLVDIQVQIPADHVATMRSTRLTIIVPRNAAGTVLVDDVSAFPMQTTISPSGPSWDGVGPLPLTLVVEVAASTRYPIRVVATPLLTLGTPLAPPTTATGTSNVPLRVSMSLEA